MAQQDQTLSDWEKLAGETARLQWKEIERLYAAGKVVEVASELDLVDVAAAFAADDKDQVRQWMQADQLGLLQDNSALIWSRGETELWGVVVNPWVLVQART